MVWGVKNQGKSRSRKKFSIANQQHGVYCASEYEGKYKFRMYTAYRKVNGKVKIRNDKTTITTKEKVEKNDWTKVSLEKISFIDRKIL